MNKTSKYPPKSLVNLAPVNIYAATYVDGNSNMDTRYVAHVGENLVFLHPEGVDSKIRQPAGWLKKPIAKKIEEFIMDNIGKADEQEVPEEKVDSLPVGSVDGIPSDLPPDMR